MLSRQGYGGAPRPGLQDIPSPSAGRMGWSPEGTRPAWPASERPAPPEEKRRLCGSPGGWRCHPREPDGQETVSPNTEMVGRAPCQVACPGMVAVGRTGRPLPPGPPSWCHQGNQVTSVLHRVCSEVINSLLQTLWRRVTRGPGEASALRRGAPPTPGAQSTGGRVDCSITAWDTQTGDPPGGGPHGAVTGAVSASSRLIRRSRGEAGEWPGSRW